MSDKLNLEDKLNQHDSNHFDELVELNVWSYKDLEYVSKRHKFQPNKINRIAYLVGEFYIETSKGKVCFRCDNNLYAENVDHSHGQFHHKKCPKDSNNKIYNVV